MSQTRKLNFNKPVNVKKKEDDISFGSSGIDTINHKILELYPDQKNHLQATAMTKYWNGGPDPLDYISMLLNKGDVTTGIPEHWHYISFGLSDLHGDGRVHDTTECEGQSGYGLELTFRLKRQPGEINPPMWPASLMNSLARYIFQTGNCLNCGDHIPWYKPLDGSQNSQICHMLIAEDNQLQQCQTDFGTFQFRQIVGITEQELKHVQQWKGNSLIQLMRKLPQTGGSLLVTDALRQQSIFDVSPKSKKLFFESVERDGSNLGHVMSVCSWEEDPVKSQSNVSGEIKSVVLKFDLEAAALLPLVMRLRLQKNKYFIYQNIAGQVIVFMPPDFDADMVTVNEQHPIKAEGQSLQIYCSDNLVTAMASDLSLLENKSYLQDKLPIKFEINSPPITIMVLSEEEIRHK